MNPDYTATVALLCLMLAGCDETKPDQIPTSSSTAKQNATATQEPTSRSEPLASAPAQSGWSIDFDGDLGDLKGDAVVFEARRRHYLLKGAPAMVQFDIGGPLDAGSTAEDVQAIRMMLTKSRRNCVYEPGGKNLKLNLKVTPKGDSLLAEFDGQLRCAPIGPQANAELTKVAGSFVVGP